MDVAVFLIAVPVGPISYRVSGIDYLLPIALGISLAAATGFRVFVPLLAAGLAARSGYIPLTDSFLWVTTTPALLMLAVAAVTEVAAYYIPLLDNLLDSLATPLAVGAGITVSYAVMGDLPPMLKWTLAIVAGGGAAAATQGATTLLRGASTLATGGLGNGVVSTGELFGAVGLSLLAILIPILAVVAALVFLAAAWRGFSRLRQKRSAGG